MHNNLFPHLQAPQLPEYTTGITPSEFTAPQPRATAEHFPAKKIYRLVICSDDREAGSAFDNAVYDVQTAPWNFPHNMALGIKHWRLQLESFIYAAGKATDSQFMAAELHLQDVTQIDSFHTSLKGQSDVIGVFVGTDTDLELGTSRIGEITISNPPSNRLRLRLTELGTEAWRGLPLLAGVTDPIYHAVISLVPVV